MYAASNTVTSVDGSDSIEVLIDNNSDKECTVITVEVRCLGKCRSRAVCSVDPGTVRSDARLAGQTSNRMDCRNCPGQAGGAPAP